MEAGPISVSIPLRKFRKLSRGLEFQVHKPVSIPLRKFRKFWNAFEYFGTHAGFHPSKEV